MFDGMILNHQGDLLRDMYAQVISPVEGAGGTRFFVIVVCIIKAYDGIIIGNA